jgi:type II secretory pathway component GspD/PulD (secretin)
MKTAVLTLIAVLAFVLPVAAQVREAPAERDEILELFDVADLVKEGRTGADLAKLVGESVPAGLTSVTERSGNVLVVRGTRKAVEAVRNLLTDLRRKAGGGSLLRVFAVGDLVTAERTAASIAEQIREFGFAGLESVQTTDAGAIVVRATRDAMTAIESLLDDLRAEQAPLVQITTRFIEVLDRAALSPAFDTEGVSLLDEDDVVALVHVVEESVHATTLQAPRLVCRNGDRANISVGASVSYVKAFEIRTQEDGSSVADPVVEKLFEGQMLDLTPTLSADHLYLTLDLDIAVSDVADPIPVREVMTAGSVKVEIQQPQFRETRLKTTVTLPPEGSALLCVGRVPGREGELYVLVSAKLLVLENILEDKPR